jgi:hypothetical protein
MKQYEFYRSEDGTSSTLSTASNISRMMGEDLISREFHLYSIWAESFEEAMKICDRIEYDTFHALWRLYYRVIGVVQC